MMSSRGKNATEAGGRGRPGLILSPTGISQRVSSVLNFCPDSGC